jgi:hypothetical protein
MYQKCCPFNPTWFCTLIIRDCTYYDALIYVMFSSFQLYPQIYGQIFSPTTPKSLTPLLWRSSFTLKCNKRSTRNTFIHTAVYRVFRELWTLLYDEGNILSGYGSLLYFNSSEHVTVNNPAGIMEFPKGRFKKSSLRTQSNFF